MAEPVDIEGARARRRSKNGAPPDGGGPDRAWFQDLARTKEGGLVKCASNAISILTHDDRWQGVLAFNEFTSAIVALKPPPWFEDDKPEAASHYPADWQDTDTVRVQAWLVRSYSQQLGKDTAWDAIAVVAERRRFHPVREYLDGLKWDGIFRLPNFLSVYLGAEQNDYMAMVGRSFLLSAVARIYRPGCKVDTMPVFEGPQGIRKSSALRALFGGPAREHGAHDASAWFSDTPIDLSSKDRFTDLRGKWGIEFAELDSLGRADANRCKSYISSPCDTFRPPYGRATVTVPRQCVFAGTTNASAYLVDHTGNRRFNPARCGVERPINLDLILQHRDQLWAEARLAFEDGAEWWPSAEMARAAGEEQAGRVQEDAWAPVIAAYLARLVLSETTVGDVLGGALDIKKDKWTQPDQNRVARCMRLCGWERSRRRRGGKLEWFYVPMTTPATAPPEASTPPSEQGAPTTKESHAAPPP